MRHEKSCGAVILHRSGNSMKVLLIKNRSGNWSFPKGHVEKGETEYETALREVKEETSLSVVLEDGFREESTYRIGRNTEKLVVYFLAFSETLHVKIQYQEISAYNWVDVKNAAEAISFDNDRRILQNALEFIAQREAK
ncbi:MAG: NUDIX domain-containing protein [Clostridia bacterium]|nr:NUDIX domain-containing protein [Clostridia bacterium]